MKEGARVHFRYGVGIGGYIYDHMEGRAVGEVEGLSDESRPPTKGSLL